jgi:hypothetical protein
MEPRSRFSFMLVAAQESMHVHEKTAPSCESKRTDAYIPCRRATTWLDSTNLRADGLGADKAYDMREFWNFVKTVREMDLGRTWRTTSTGLFSVR